MRAAVLKFTFAVIIYQSNKFYITYIFRKLVKLCCNKFFF